MLTNKDINFIIHVLEIMKLNSEAAKNLTKDEKYKLLKSSLELRNIDTSPLSSLTEDQINESFDSQYRRYGTVINKLKQMLNEN